MELRSHNTCNKGNKYKGNIQNNIVHKYMQLISWGSKRVKSYINVFYDF